MLVVGCFPCHAANIVLTSSADTSLLEVAPTNSNGGQDFFNCGTTQNGPRNRALLRFNLSALPTNAVILTASVQLSVVHVPAEPGAASPFSLHRMLRNWNEGTNVAALNIGQGSPAKPGDATWTHAQFNTIAWGAPGGLPGTDFFPFESASQFIYDVGQSPYIFGPTTELASDVQGWVADPASNFGWFFLCDDEGTRFTARRFGARNNSNPAARPQLSLTYLIPPVITSTAINGDNFQFTFRAESGHSYTVEHRSAINSGTWQPLANLGQFTNTADVIFIDAAAQPAHYYRLRGY